MSIKKNELSPDLIIHPGETIGDILIERNITQAELAARIGVSAAYVSNVISGKKDISAKFANGLEYALGVPKKFWLNLQANYDAEKLELNEVFSITDEERNIRERLNGVVSYLRISGKIPEKERTDDSILSLRKYLQVSNLSNIKDVLTSGSFRSIGGTDDPCIIGVWERIREIYGKSYIGYE